MLLFEAIALCKVADLAARALGACTIIVGFVGILIGRIWTKSISSSSLSFFGA